MKRLKKQITPSLLISSLALFVALGGASYAALAKNSVGSNQLKKNAVVTKKIKNKAVSAAKIKGGAITTGKIKKDAVTGAKVKESSLGTVPNATNAAAAELANVATSAQSLDGYRTYKQTRIAATSGPTDAAARAAAPENVMFTAGPITIYSKCFTDASGPDTNASIFIKTSENGVLFESAEDRFDGDPLFLNTDTLETNRELLEEGAGANAADVEADSSNATSVFTPSGLSFEMQPSIAVKNGTLAGGNGLYGDGGACIFSGSLSERNG